MKKKLLILVVFILALLTAVWLIIPAGKRFQFEESVNCTDQGALRLITSAEKWKQWWPGTVTDSTHYEFEGITYRPDKLLFTGFEATLFYKGDSQKVQLTVFSANNNQSSFSWDTRFDYGTNPVTKIRRYFSTGAVKKNLAHLSARMKTFFDKEENIYGLTIHYQQVKDPVLITTKKTFPHYPSVTEVYALVSTLKNYIRQQKGEATNDPMLHINRSSDTEYDVMVAIATKEELPASGNLIPKRMVRGNILMAEVKGGETAVASGFRGLTSYINDYRKSSPAIPYQLLVTDRQLEPDSNKWITQLYYPIFY